MLHDRTLRRRAPAIGLLAALLVLLPAAVELGAQEPLRLSLEEAVALALRSNPGFQSIRNDEEVAEWQVRSAWASLLPSASVSAGAGWQGSGEQRLGSLSFGEGLSYYLSSYSLGASLDLSGSDILAPGQAKVGRGAAQARTASEAALLELDVTRAYVEVLRREEALRLVRQELERARFNLRLARGQQEVGLVSPLDAKQAEVAVGRAEVAVLREEANLHVARLQLLRVLGLEMDHDVTLTTEFGLVEPSWSEEELYALALERNPQLVGLRAQLEYENYGVKMARTAYLPTLSFSAGMGGFTRAASEVQPLVDQARFGAANEVAQCQALNDLYGRLADPLPSQDCTRYRFTDQDLSDIVRANDAFPFDFTRTQPSVSFSISLPVFQGLRRQLQLEAARVDRDDVEHAIREQRLAVQAEISGSLAQLRAAWRSALLEEQNQELADEQLRLAQERYRLGLAGFLELVEAETVKAEADRALLTAIFTYHDALAQLEATVGASLRPE